jgi:catechol 2,3-dioxygenase-like lactoylglutathione lyase family enzyme
MRLPIVVLVAALTAAPLTTLAQQSRPAITGISHLCVYTSDAAGADHFYGADLGAQKAPDPEDPAGVRYYFSPVQFVEVLPLPAQHGISRMAHSAYNTPDVAALRQYLAAHGIAALSLIRQGSDGSQWFETKDPEGNTVQFVQPAATQAPAGAEAISHHIIHVGLMVHSPSAEDHFYRELLGFRPYWHGAMQSDKTDWVSQQVPDGHDWVEYMLVGDGSTTPLSRVDTATLGVMNHFSLGVPNMEQAMTLLISADRLSPKHNGPQMGRDGKWQANLFDPDGTRVELMEFQPVMKPCCSEFTAPSPVN